MVGRGVLEGGEGAGEGVGWDPSPLWPPPKAGQTFSSFNPLEAEGTKAKFWLSASNIGRAGGGPRGGGGLLLRCTAILILPCLSPAGPGIQRSVGQWQGCP